MEERVINILLDIKADIGGIKNRIDQVEPILAAGWTVLKPKFLNSNLTEDKVICGI